MSNPTDRVKPYAALAHIEGANTYGIPREKWSKLTAKQKVSFRQRMYIERLKADPEAYAEHKRCRIENRADETIQKRRANNIAWKIANREKVLAYKRKHERKVRARKALMLNTDRILETILRAIPRAWPKHVRDDIAGMIFLDILEKRSSLENVDQLVKSASTKFHRTMETWKTRSLDAPIAGTDRPLLDLITTENLPWH